MFIKKHKEILSTEVGLQSFGGPSANAYTNEQPFSAIAHPSPKSYHYDYDSKQSMLEAPRDRAIFDITLSESTDSEFEPKLTSIDYTKKEPVILTDKDYTRAALKQIGSVAANAIPKLVTELVLGLPMSFANQIGKKFRKPKAAQNTDLKKSGVQVNLKDNSGKVKLSLNLAELNLTLKALGKIETEYATLEHLKLSSKNNKLAITTQVTLKSAAELQKIDMGCSDNSILRHLEGLGLCMINTAFIAEGQSRFIEAELDLGFIQNGEDTLLHIVPSNIHVTFNDYSFEDPLVQFITNNSLAKPYLEIKLPMEEYLSQTLISEDLGLEGTGKINIKPLNITPKSDKIELDLGLQIIAEPKPQAQDITPNKQLEAIRKVQDNLLPWISKTAGKITNRTKKGVIYTAALLNSKNKRNKTEKDSITDSTQQTSEKKSGSFELAQIDIDLNIKQLNDLIQAVRIDDSTVFNDIQIQEENGKYTFTGSLQQAGKPNFKITGKVAFEISPDAGLRIKVNRLRSSGFDIRAAAYHFVKAMGMLKTKEFNIDIPLEDLIGEYQMNVPTNQSKKDRKAIQAQTKYILDQFTTLKTQKDNLLSLSIKVVAELKNLSNINIKK